MLAHLAVLSIRVAQFVNGDAFNVLEPFRHVGCSKDSKSPTMAPTKPRNERHTDPALPFDVTQEIDPALAEWLRRGSEPTLNQADFDDIALELPPKPSRKS